MTIKGTLRAGDCEVPDKGDFLIDGTTMADKMIDQFGRSGLDPPKALIANGQGRVSASFLHGAISGQPLEDTQTHGDQHYPDRDNHEILERLRILHPDEDQLEEVYR